MNQGGGSAFADTCCPPAGRTQGGRDFGCTKSKAERAQRQMLVPSLQRSTVVAVDPHNGQAGGGSGSAMAVWLLR
jgi:hypothetical protein